jgi:hypothetical protein
MSGEALSIRGHCLPSPLEGEGSRRRRVGEGDDLSANSELEESHSPSPGSASPRRPLPPGERAKGGGTRYE